MKSKLREFIESAFFDVTGCEVSSIRRQENIMSLLNTFVDAIFHKRVGQEKVNIRYRKIFRFDSPEIQNKMERDKILSRIILGKKHEEERKGVPISFQKIE